MTKYKKRQTTKQEELLGFKPVKGCITFKTLRKLTNGYKTIQTADGGTYDYVGVDVETKEGNTVTIAVEFLPNGVNNMYVISSLYEIQLPSIVHRTIGKLVFTGKKQVR